MKLNDWLRWILYAGIVLVPFTILPVFNGFFFPFITSKAFLFRILVEVMLFVWVVLAIRDSFYRPKVSGILLAILAFVSAITVSAFLGEDFSRSFWSNYERMTGVVAYLHFALFFFIIASFLRTLREWHVFFFVWLGLSLVIGFEGFSELGSTGRIDSALGNPIYLAAYSMMNVFLAGFLIENVRANRLSPFLGWFYGFAGVLNLVVLYFTDTRGSILGLLGGIFLAGLLVAIFEKKRILLRKSAILLCIIFVALPFLFYGLKDTPLIRNSQTLARFTEISLEEGTGGARLELWEMSVKAWVEHPFFGYGLGNFGLVFSEYYSPEMYAEESWFDRAHSVLFNFFVLTGVVGLLSYLSLYAFSLLSLWRLKWLRKKIAKFFPSTNVDNRVILARFKSKFTDRENKEFTFVGKCILTGLLAAYFVHGLFVFGDTVSLILFFAVLAFIHQRVSRNRLSIFGEKIAAKSTQIIFVIIAGILVLASLYFANFLPMRQNVTLSNALFEKDPAVRLDLFQKALAYDTFGDRETREQLILATRGITAPNVPKELVSAYYQAAEKAAQTSIQKRPDDPRPYFFQAIFYLGFSEFEKALASINESLALSPKKQQFLELKTKILLHLERYDEAVETSRYSYELLEENDAAANLYAASIIYKGEEIDRAEEFLENRYGTDLIPEDMFINAYVHQGDLNTVAELWERRAEKFPNKVRPWLSLAYTYSKIGKDDKAIQTFQEVAKRWPELSKQVDSYIADIKAGRDPG